MKQSNAIFVGIDVSKEKVDVYAQGRSWTVSQEQLEGLVDELCKLSPHWVILEPTGNYELPLVNKLVEAGLRVARPHVTRMSYHARGRRNNKTDRLDAEALAHYGQCYAEELRAYQPDEKQQLLYSLYQRSIQLVKMRTQEKNRLSHSELPKPIRQGIARMIAHLDQQLLLLEKEIEALIKSTPLFKRRWELLQTLPGVGSKVAAGLLALMPELGELKRKQAGALAGVVPIIRSSGKKRGQASIGGGRYEVRQLMYLSALSASRYCPEVRAFYTHLRSEGKTGKQALVACMHKMLRMLNAMLKNNQPYLKQSLDS